MTAFWTLASLGAAIALLGCASKQQRVETAGAAVMQARQACEAKFPLRPGNILANSHCLDEVENQFIRPQTPYPDLLTTQQAYRAELATKVDQGTLTLQAARFQMDGYMAQLNDQALARQAAAAHIGAAQQPIAPGSPQKAAPTGSVTP